MERTRIQARRLLLLIVALVALMTAVRPATAGFSAELVDIVPEGIRYRWNYQLVFDTLAGRERIQVGNGTLAPGVFGSQDFITIYDIGLSFDILEVTAGPGFTFQLQNIGVEFPQVIPNDESGLLNLTYRFVGPPAAVSEEAVFTGFSILSPFDGGFFSPPRVDEYFSQSTDNLGLDAHRKITTLGPILVPVRIPEPRTWLILLLACLGVIAMRQVRLRRPEPAKRDE